MQRFHATLETSLSAAKRQLAAPAQPALWLQVLVVLLFVAAYIALAYWSGTERQPDRHFDEGGAIDILSALFLVMAGAFAWACFLLRARDRDMLRARDRDWGGWFWLLLSVGFLFLALDEMLEFHERFDGWIRNTWVGWPPLFRNWNDVIVIGYGVAGLALLVTFRSEILRLPRAAALLGLGGLFYVMHTGIDSLVSGSPMKTVVEESAKLTATAFFALAMLAAFMALLASMRSDTGAAPSSEDQRSIAPRPRSRSVSADPTAAG